MTHADFAFADAIKAIVAHSGEAILQNETQTIAMFSDLAPQLKREKELLKQFYKCDGCNLLLAARGMATSQRKAQKEKVVKLLIENYWVADAAAYHVCNQFWYAISGEIPSDGTEASQKTYRSAITKIVEGNIHAAFHELEKTAQSKYIPAQLMYAHLCLTVQKDAIKARTIWTEVEASEPANTWVTIGKQMDQARLYSEALAYFLAAGARNNDSYSLFLASKMWVKKGCHSQAIAAIRQSAKMGCTQAKTFQDKLAAWPEDVVRSHAFTDEAPV